MFRDSRRYLIVIALLILAGLAQMALITRGVLPRLRATPTAGMEGPLYTFFVDTEGWYRITSHERAVLSRIDFRLQALPESLPMALGEWQGADYDAGRDAIDRWYGHPDLILQRRYERGPHEVVYLEIIGSQGGKSFHLFEHTPAICYPMSRWRIVEQGVEPLPLGDEALYVQKLVAERDSQREMALYWYMWDNADRDPARGILSLRLITPIVGSEEGAWALLKDHFLPELFADVISSWCRF